MPKKKTLPHHDEYKDYTAHELNEITKEVCMAHKCPYLGGVNTYYKGVALGNKPCCYFIRTGKRRGCMPDECKHWKDKVAEPPRFADKAFDNNGVDSDKFYVKKSSLLEC